MFTQQGVGTTPGYAALDDRRANIGGLQEGVYGTSTLVTAGGVGSVGSADFMVTQRAAGANQSVDVNMPAGGFAFVQGDTINGQGLYCVPVHSGNINETVAGSDPTNPRVDQLILEVQDNVLDASGGNLARTRVLTGTPTGGTTLTSRAGAAALPASALLLADVLVPATSTSVPNSNIRDRRKWARGAFDSISRNAGSFTVAGSLTLIDSTNVQPRIECSGVPLRATLKGSVTVGSAGTVDVDLMVDGTAQTRRIEVGGAANPAGETHNLSLSWLITPAAGSHLVGPAAIAVVSGSILATGNYTLEFTVEEVVRQNAANSNGVTTG